MSDLAREALRLAVSALNNAPTSCPYHGEDFGEIEAWSGLPRCDSCRQPYRVKRARDAVRRALESDA